MNFNYSQSPEQILKKYFGYDSFREGQSALVNGILSHKDVVGVMPTGAGKSICFQIPALIFSGVTIVISPLISLMKDQVNALAQSGVNAAFINSSLSEKQVQTVLENLKKGDYKILYIAPERLDLPYFLEFAKTLDISMVTVDEAHCVSHWGQDFRPSYLKISEFINSLPKRPVVSAFTATATPKVREDIVSMLELRDPIVLVTGFDRKNLYFEVQKSNDKFLALLKYLRDKKEKSGIIYCSTRKTVEEVCDKLNENGINATRYHAGLSDNERKENQDDFIFDNKKIIAATNAFGMGIDKSNVSFVVHYNMPKDIESYYQEAGRAGRDGGNAECILYYSGADVRTNLYLIENGKDSEYTDSQTERMIKERDRQRLREMVSYCQTTDCLRLYILKYFNETAAKTCGNCGNCSIDFEERDITIDAQKIISCVIRAKERYGIRTIIDVIRGSKNEKIKRFGLDKLSTYGISNLSAEELKEIIDYLVLNDYLFVTNDKYPILLIGGRANEVLNRDEPVIMKTIKKEAKEAPLTTERAKPKTVGGIKTIDNRLFEKLRAVRLKLASEQKVPAFVIFADSTLLDMCMKLPADEIEFLQVSGVGQIKSERYGKIFLEAIAEFSSGNDKNDREKIIQIEEEMTQDKIEILNYPVSVSVIADNINCLLLRRGMKKTSGFKINEWLLSKGYLKVITDENGQNVKLPTEEGMDLGIKGENRVIRGEECLINLYNENAQQFIVDSVQHMLEKT